MLIMIVISVLFLFLGNWLYNQHEHVKFNYEGSFWHKLDKKMKQPWFKNNSRPDLQMLYPWIPPIWDGYHCFSWLMKWTYYMPFALMLCLFTEWFFVAGGTIIYAFVSLTWSKITYHWTFK